jgi:hypothetical protein
LMTSTAAGMTSLPMPSPGMTAIFLGVLTLRTINQSVSAAKDATFLA